MFEYGKTFRPTDTKFLNGFCIPFTIGLLVLGAYGLINEDGVEAKITIGISMLLFIIFLIGLLFLYFNVGPIVVNDRAIVARKPKGPVSIPWKDIEKIYYAIGRGGHPGDPHFSVYLFSKTKDFIIVRRATEEISELMDAIRSYAKPRQTKYISFSEVVSVFLRYYFRRS